MTGIDDLPVSIRQPEFLSDPRTIKLQWKYANFGLLGFMLRISFGNLTVDIYSLGSNTIFSPLIWLSL